MKRIILTLFCFVVTFSSQAFAMQLSQPIKLGEFYQTQVRGSGFVINGATQNDGDYYTVYDKNNRKTFGKGIARFGNGKNSVYFHYNAYNMPRYDANARKTIPAKGDISRIGGKDYQNTIPFNFGPRTISVSIINGQNGYTFFLLKGGYDIESDEMVSVIGQLPNGKFVKYFISNDITKKYFGKGQSPCYGELTVKNDTLILQYKLTTNGTVLTTISSGEFRFKWDDKAQWFGIEQVVY